MLLTLHIDVICNYVESLMLGFYTRISYSFLLSKSMEVQSLNVQTQYHKIHPRRKW